MIITEISVCKKSKDRCNIYIDGGFSCALFFDTVAEYGLKKGKNIETDELDTIIYEDRCRLCYMKGCYLLSIRQRGERELGHKLAEKGFNSEEIAAAIDMLKSRGYIDDLAFAREYAEHLQKKGYGGFAIKQRLYQKGIDGDSINIAISELTHEDNEKAAMEYAKRAYARALREDDKYKRKNKFLSAMGRHGFDYGCAKEIFSILEKDHD